MAEIYYNRGLANSSLMRFEEAIRDHKKAIDEMNDNSKVFKMRFQLGVTLRRVANQQIDTKQFDALISKSIDELKKATEIQAQDPSALNNLGLSLFEANKLDEAIECYTKAIQFEEAEMKENRASNPENLSYFYKNRGLAYFHRQDEDDMVAALKDYKLAIGKNPDNADNYFNKGNVHLTKKEFSEAHKDFDTAIEKEELNAKFYHAKGLAFQREVEAMQDQKDKDQELEEEKTNSAIAYYGMAL